MKTLSSAPSSYETSVQKNGIKKKPNKTQLAYETIKKRILSGEYPTGTRLSERSLEADLQLSRTPIKTALDQLSFEGYLEASPDRTAVVTKIGFSEVLEIYELREAIEILSVRLASRRRTDADLRKMKKCLEKHRETLDKNIEDAEIYDARFHMYIAEASRNSQIAVHLKLLIDHCRRASLYQNRTNTNRVKSSIQQHEKILHHIQRREEEEAGKAMAAHLEDVIATTKDLMAEYYFMYR